VWNLLSLASIGFCFNYFYSSFKIYINVFFLFLLEFVLLFDVKTTY
ncbi:MAG: hypothetical protein ACI90V_000937, partial [Bacillariaceae sp.]